MTITIKDLVLGNTYTDKITKFTGVAIGYSKWLTGCDTVGLQPFIDKDGKIPDSEWFDITRLLVTQDNCDDEASDKPERKKKPLGGPQLTPKQAH